MLNLLKRRQPTASTPQITAPEAVSRLANGELTLIDVRDINEVRKSGKAKGALHIPLTTLGLRADPRNPDFHPALDVDKPVALYCASGARSNMAANMLRQLGYKSVHNIGGLGHWVSAGGAVEN